MFRPRKVGWLDYGRRGLCEGGEGRGTEKRGGETKILKGGASWVKGWGLESPYELWLYF